jgi:hypothetical protein
MSAAGMGATRTIATCHGSSRQWLSAEHAAVAEALVKRELEVVAESITGPRDGNRNGEGVGRGRELAYVLAALHGESAR